MTCVVKRKLIGGLSAAAVTMLLLPWAAHLLGDDFDLAYCYLLWYLVYPVFSIAIGLFSSKERLWCLPVLSAVFFLIGMGTAFTWTEPYFFIYAFCYLLLGLLFCFRPFSRKK